MGKSHRKSKFAIPGVKPNQRPFTPLASSPFSKSTLAAKVRRRLARLQRRYGNK